MSTDDLEYDDDFDMKKGGSTHGREKRDIKGAREIHKLSEQDLTRNESLKESKKKKKDGS